MVVHMMLMAVSKMGLCYDRLAPVPFQGEKRTSLRVAGSGIEVEVARTFFK